MEIEHVFLVNPDHGIVDVMVPLSEFISVTVMVPYKNLMLWYPSLNPVVGSYSP